MYAQARAACPLISTLVGEPFMKLRTLFAIVALVVVSALITACGGGPKPESLAASQQRQDDQVAAETGVPKPAMTPSGAAAGSTNMGGPSGGMMPSSDTGGNSAATGGTAAPKLDAAMMTAAKTTFTSTCGGCHTLKDAGTVGQVGPILDGLAAAQLTYDHIEMQIMNGGNGMPAGLLSGKDAENVAAYVSSVAGK